MRVVDAVAEILKREGVEYLSCYPTTALIESVAAVGIRPLLCRQERVGVHIADGYSRVANGRRLGVFAMQYGPGAENAFPGIATAFSDSTPLLLLPLGHARERAQTFPLFRSSRTYASVVKSVDEAALAAYRPASSSRPGGNPAELEAAARMLVEAKRPVIEAGQGVLYAEATPELIELAELLQAPVMTTLEGKSAFPEDHPLALG